MNLTRSAAKQKNRNSKLFCSKNAVFFVNKKQTLCHLAKKGIYEIKCNMTAKFNIFDLEKNRKENIIGNFFRGNKYSILLDILMNFK